MTPPYMIVSLAVSEAEHTLLLEMMGTLGLPSYAGLLQTALFELALHRCTMRVPSDAFTLVMKKQAAALTNRGNLSAGQRHGTHATGTTDANGKGQIDG